MTKNFDMVEHKGKQYLCRVIPGYDTGEDFLLISTSELSKEVMNENGDNWKDEDSEYTDGLVYGYTTEEDLITLSDKKLFNLF